MTVIIILTFLTYESFVEMRHRENAVISAKEDGKEPHLAQTTNLLMNKFR